MMYPLLPVMNLKFFQCTPLVWSFKCWDLHSVQMLTTHQKIFIWLPFLYCCCTYISPIACLSGHSKSSWLPYEIKHVYEQHSFYRMPCLNSSPCHGNAQEPVVFVSINFVFAFCSQHHQSTVLEVSWYACRLVHDCCYNAQQSIQFWMRKVYLILKLSDSPCTGLMSVYSKYERDIEKRRYLGGRCHECC